MNKSRKLKSRFRLFLLSALFMVAVLFPLSSRAATTADVIFVVDESGSMAGEHVWLGTMITALDAKLNTAGVTGNRYALVGYGASSGGGAHGTSQRGHKHTVGGGDYGTAAQFSTATGALVTTGSKEDGYEAINFALNNYAFRSGAAVNIVLVTDEDRDVNASGIHSFASIKADLASKNAMLNAVIDNNFTDGTGTAIGVFDDGSGLGSYLADGSGGFTIGANGVIGNGSGSTEVDYAPLAVQTGGGAWDLGILRTGGNGALSFTAAFVDLKVNEIVFTPGGDPSPVPEPGMTILMGSGLLVLFGYSWHKKKQAI